MEGRFATGQGAGQDFVAAWSDALTEALDFRPFPGTFNLSGVDDLEDLSAQVVHGIGDEHCEGTALRPCRVAGVRSAIVRPFVPGYPPEKTELLAPVRLRSLYELSPGDRVVLSTPSQSRPAWAPPVRADALDQFDAAVFDLDGTLLDLAVDWSTVQTEVEALVGEYLDGAIADVGRRTLFDVARDHDLDGALHDLIEAHEVEGAETATSRPLLALIDRLACPVGICTANAVGAAEAALDRFGRLDAVDVVIGRESLDRQKPHPAPLAACLEALDARPGNAVFVGNEETDAETATRAGTSYFDEGRFAFDGGSPRDTASSSRA